MFKKIASFLLVFFLLISFVSAYVEEVSYGNDYVAVFRTKFSFFDKLKNLFKLQATIPPEVESGQSFTFITEFFPKKPLVGVGAVRVVIEKDGSVISGYPKCIPLTDYAKSELEKGNYAFMSLTLKAPSQTGEYIYRARPAQYGCSVYFTNQDVYEDYDKFKVTSTHWVGCPDPYTKTETVPIAHGTMTKIYWITYGDYPECEEIKKFVSATVECDEGYEPKGQGINSYCGKKQEQEQEPEEEQEEQEQVKKGCPEGQVCCKFLVGFGKWDWECRDPKDCETILFQQTIEKDPTIAALKCGGSSEGSDESSDEPEIKQAEKSYTLQEIQDLSASELAKAFCGSDGYGTYECKKGSCKSFNYLMNKDKIEEPTAKTIIKLVTGDSVQWLRKEIAEEYGLCIYKSETDYSNLYEWAPEDFPTNNQAVNAGIIVVIAFFVISFLFNNLNRR